MCESKEPIVNLAQLDIEDYECVKQNIVLRLVNTGRCRNMLKESPHMDIMDLSLLCYIDLGFSSEGWTQAVRIRNHHLDLWGITRSRLFEDALENTPRYLPPVFAPLDEVLTGVMENYRGDLSENGHPRPEGLPLIFVLTNRRKKYGACALFFPDLLEHIRAMIGPFYVLPSSIHEVILVRDKDFVDSDTLRDIVLSVNAEPEMADEYLSDNLYYYGGTDVPLQAV